MSTPEASSTRQRTNKMAGDDAEGETENPASLSGNMNKKVPRNKPHVKPPFSEISMNRFLLYLVLGLLAVAAFYIWTFVSYVSTIGGMWALISGRHHTKTAGASVSSGMEAIASSVSSSAASASSTAKTGKSSGKPSGQGQAGNDVETQIFNLANALGVKPAELSNAIRPLIDPSAPNPVDVAKMEAEALKQQIAATQAEAKTEEHGSLLGMMGEALLD